MSRLFLFECFCGVGVGMPGGWFLGRVAVVILLSGPILLYVQVVDGVTRLRFFISAATTTIVMSSLLFGFFGQIVALITGRAFVWWRTQRGIAENVHSRISLFLTFLLQFFLFQSTISPILGSRMSCFLHHCSIIIIDLSRINIYRHWCPYRTWRLMMLLILLLS